MRRFWYKISNLGIHTSMDESEGRRYMLSNQLNFIVFVICLLLTLATAVFREINGGEFTIHTQKILFLALVAGINIFLSYKAHFKWVRFNLIIFPSLLLVYLPVFLGQVQQIDFYIDPLVIIASSLVPAITLDPDFRSPVYILCFFYFLLQAIVVDHALIYFSGSEFSTVGKIEHFHFYFKLTFIGVFIFIYFLLYYYRRINLEYHRRLQQANDALQSSLRELRETNRELSVKNEIIVEKNSEINATLNHLKETQSQLLQSEKMASLGTLTAGVAHEINNPLNYLMGAYIGLRNYFKDHGAAKEANTEVLLNSMDMGITRISDIVRGLNQFSRNNENMNEDCDIPAILDNCLTMLQNKTKHKAEILKDFPEGPVLARGNVGKLHQVFLNIFTNSIQALAEKGTITAKTRIEEKRVVVEIIDNGMGIEKKFLRQIADPFFTTKAPGQGTGLGLSIAYTIVREHQGTMDFESEPNKGTRATITLPLKQA